MLWDWVMGSLKRYPKNDSDEDESPKSAMRHTVAPPAEKEKAG